MLEAVELPAGVTNLDTGLSNVYTNTFSHYALLGVGGCSSEGERLRVARSARLLYLKWRVRGE